MYNHGINIIKQSIILLQVELATSKNGLDLTIVNLL